MNHNKKQRFIDIFSDEDKQYLEKLIGTDDAIPAREFEDVADLLHRLNRHRTSILSTYSEDGIETASSTTLQIIAEKPIRASELAQITCYDPSTITRQMNQLISRNLVQRIPDDSDARATILTVTEQGKERAKIIREVRNHYYSVVFKNWSTQERRDFIASLRRFVADSEALTQHIHG